MLETVIEWLTLNWVALANVIVIDVVLAGDNAIVVGLAASQVAPHLRARVIFWGIAGAVVLRIAFAAVASQLLQIVGITLAGGLLLLWVCWKMYRQILQHTATPQPHALGAAAVDGGDGSGTARVRELSLWAAIGQVIIADVSMSLDNVLAVAGAAKGSPLVLVIGLGVAIVLMAIASHFIARLLSKYPSITWIGLLIIVYVALDMIFTGSHEVACKAYEFGCETNAFQWAKGVVMPWFGLSSP